MGATGGENQDVTGSGNGGNCGSGNTIKTDYKIEMQLTLISSLNQIMHVNHPIQIMHFQPICNNFEIG